MPTFTLIIAALIQGITEFLPVSSSAHLFLWNHFQGIGAQAFPYEMVLNAGTLFALIVYFRHDLFCMTRDLIKQCAGKGGSSYSTLAWLLVLSTLPVCIIGFFFHDYISEHLRSIVLMGVMLMFFGVLLGISDMSLREGRSPTKQSIHHKALHITLPQALLIGLAQVFALIPGASRSGTTITAARFLGLSREVSVRYSFLLAIPVMIAAVSLALLKAFKNNIEFNPLDIIIGFSVSAGVGLLCIHVLLRFITRIGFMPFAIYRVLLGAVIIYLFYS